MATTKKKSVPKKTVLARVPAKKSVAARPARKSAAKKSELRSFAVCSEPTPFLTFRPSVQTFYWLILGVFVVSFGAWVILLTVKVQNIYDQIEINNTAINTLLPKPVKKSP